MEYHDLGTIPSSYKTLWAQRLLDTQVQIPAHIAISKALTWKGRVEEAVGRPSCGILAAWDRTGK